MNQKNKRYKNKKELLLSPKKGKKATIQLERWFLRKCILDLKQCIGNGNSIKEGEFWK